MLLNTFNENIVLYLQISIKDGVHMLQRPSGRVSESKQDELVIVGR